MGLHQSIDKTSLTSVKTYNKDQCTLRNSLCEKSIVISFEELLLIPEYTLQQEIEFYKDIYYVISFQLTANLERKYGHQFLSEPNCFISSIVYTPYGNMDSLPSLLKPS